MEVKPIVEISKSWEIYAKPHKEFPVWADIEARELECMERLWDEEKCIMLYLLQRKMKI